VKYSAGIGKYTAGTAPDQAGQTYNCAGQAKDPQEVDKILQES
jgi:hypothetical protein